MTFAICIMVISLNALGRFQGSQSMYKAYKAEVGGQLSVNNVKMTFLFSFFLPTKCNININHIFWDL